MKLNVVYQEEVTDNGYFVTSAKITPSQITKDLQKRISFTIEGKELQLTKIEKEQNQIIYYFKLTKELLVLNFDPAKFINQVALPQIMLHVNGMQPKIEVAFQPDPFLADFKQKIIQTDTIQLSYSIYASGTNRKKRPLVLFLHGSGERGFNNGMPLLANDVPKTLHDYAKTKEDAVILVPQATWAPTLNGWFRKDFRKALFILLKQIESEYNIDTKRIYLTGLSNGASTTWYMGVHHADLFAALVPCSGYVYDDGKKGYGDQGKGRYMLASPEEGKTLAQLPIWAFHADDDPTVGVLGTKKAEEAIHQAGGKQLKVTIYPKNTVKPNPHASWARAFNTPELLPWLFKQHK